jgi:hypothetical protein
MAQIKKYNKNLQFFLSKTTQRSRDCMTGYNPNLELVEVFQTINKRTTFSNFNTSSSTHFNNIEDRYTNGYIS